MARKRNALAMWRNATQIGMIMAEAQTVIAMRLMGMSGVWSVAPSENDRMVSEKVEALTKAMTDSARVVLRGGNADQIAAAAIKPIRNKTRANARRLGKLGPKV